MAKSTRDRSKGVIENYLRPAFGKLCLRDLTPLTIQRYFSEMATSPLAHESRDKIRDVLSSVLGSAVNHGLLIKNPAEAIRFPAERKGRNRSKPYLTSGQFDQLIAHVPEPYATMVYVAIYTGLRVSELAGLSWNDLGEHSITIDERFCRGDWGAPKSDASNATIGVNRCVIERIHRLKITTVSVRAGRAVRKYRVVKSDGPNDLVFQSVKEWQADPRQQHSLSVHKTGRQKDWTAMGELEEPAHFACGMAEAGRRRCEGRARTDATFTSQHDARYLSAVRAGITATSS